MAHDNETERLDVDAVLDGIMIAAPCDVSWESMEGDDRVRFCGSCKLNVYNTRAMTKREVAELMSREGRLPCLRIYRRFDGTLITDDCPVGLRKIRDAYKRAARRVAAGWAAIVSVVTGVLPVWGQGNQQAAEKNSPEWIEGSTKGDDFVGLVEPRGWMPRFGPGGSCQNPSEFQADTRAHKQAMDFYLKALEADRKHDAEADGLYRKAIEAIGGTHQDPKFVEHVCRNYARFLVDHDKSHRARLIMDEYKLYKAWLAKNATSSAGSLGTMVGGMGLGTVPIKVRRGH